VAKTDEAAYAAVEAELRRNPNATQDELLEKAKEASPGIARLNRREFNARYPLQIKRKILRESGGGAPRKRRAGAKKAAGKKRGRRGRRPGTKVAAAAPRRKPGRPKGSGRKTTAAASAGSMNREAVRQVLLGFASDVVSASYRPKDLFKLLAGVDKYVDRLAKA
jgi:hypothetical protein